MEEEFEGEQKKREASYKDSLFAHAFINQNPKLYRALYPEDFGLDEEAEKGIEWEVPKTPAEIEAMLDELRSTGYQTD